MTAKRKQILILGLRIVVSLGMLAVLILRVPSFEWSDLIPEWTLVALEPRRAVRVGAARRSDSAAARGDERQRARPGERS